MKYLEEVSGLYSALFSDLRCFLWAIAACLLASVSLMLGGWGPLVALSSGALVFVLIPFAAALGAR